MSKTMSTKLSASDILNQAVTAAVIEAGKTLEASEIKAILDRISEMIESDE